MNDGILNKLIENGWQRRSSASGSRLQEAIDNYRSLGFEVKTVPMKELVGDGCNECFDNEHDTTMMIFTREAGKNRVGDLVPNEGE